MKFLTFCMLPALFVMGVTISEDQPAVKKVKSFDNVEIVYSVQGEKEPALVFIHGGFADRSFWKNQFAYFSGNHKVVAVDLAGHGDSGENRTDWGILPFARDVEAVIKNENINKAVLIGNSLGGPVALQTARLIPEKAVAVVGIDTFQILSMEAPEGYWQARAKAFRENFEATMKEMVRALFHPDTYPELQAYALEIMLKGSPEIAAALMESLSSFDLAELAKGLDIPIRSLNGDLYQTQIQKNREIHPDFDAVILPKTGHYPMLEKPELFNQHLKKILDEFQNQ
jgi:pimeloyl-ACP methyl ester carboxylesterase